MEICRESVLPGGSSEFHVSHGNLTLAEGGGEGGGRLDQEERPDDKVPSYFLQSK